MFWWFLAGVLGLLVICCAGLLFGSRGRVGGSCRCGGPGGPSGRGRQGRQGRRSALSLFGDLCWQNFFQLDEVFEILVFVWCWTSCNRRYFM